jgi:scyllo-inositol 2-dehydrogenase (NAD+)
MEGAYLAAVCDLDPGKLSSVAADFGSKAYDSIAALLADDMVEAVVVATPTAVHVEPVEAVLKAGKALFCEKPLASTLDDNVMLAEKIKNKGLLCQIGFNRRFDPDYLHARRIIEGGKIGSPVYFHGVSRDPFPPPAWACNPETGGGLFIDMLLHDYDIARFLMNADIVEVFAREAHLVVDSGGTPRFADNVTVDFQFASGALGSCHGSMHAEYGYDIRSEVYGSRGDLQIGGLQKDSLTYCSKAVGISQPSTFLWEGEEPHFFARFRESYERELQGFVDALRTGSPAKATVDDALQAFRVAVAALESAETGRPVTVAPI